MVAPAAWAGEPGGRAPTGDVPLVGGFGVGDGLEALVDERTGDLSLGLSAGGVGIGWDSRLIGRDRFGFGDGWAIADLPFVDRKGGTRIYAGDGGPFDLDVSSPSGMLGYDLGDRVFEIGSGTMPARTDVDVSAALGEDVDREVEIGFVLRELGGVVTSFNREGDPISRVARSGDRFDWIWDRTVPHRLRGVVSPDGVVTGLDWQTEQDAVHIRVGVNLSATDPENPATIAAGRATSPATGAAWRVGIGRDGIDITDPVGGIVQAVVDRNTGLVSRLAGPTGSETVIVWTHPTDGAARVEQVTTFDEDDSEVSSRRWAPLTDSRARSGWPVTDAAVGIAAADGRTSAISDGPTRVVSEWTPSGLLASRRVETTSPSGTSVEQTHTFSYPRVEPGEAGWSRPTSTEIVYHGEAGDTRTTSEAYRFDALGRLVERTGPDGTTERTVYDAIVPAGERLPIGLPLRVVTIADDGSATVSDTRLNDARTQVTAVDEYRGTVDGDRLEELATVEDLSGAGLTRTSRVERDVRTDGFVTEQRAFPSGDPAETPIVTRWTEHTDLAAGVVTIGEITAAGSAAEASTSLTTSLRHGGALAATDALGNTGWSAYDPAGRVISQVDASGNHTATAYESAAQHGRNATIVTTPNDVVTTRVHDALGRLRQVQDSVRNGQPVDGHVRVTETRAYPVPGTIEITDAWGATTTTQQDVQGRPIAETTPGGVTRFTKYDDLRRRTTTSVTNGDPADALMTVAQTHDPANRTATTTGTRQDQFAVPESLVEYDGFGHESFTTNGLIDRSVDRDPLGRAISTTIAPAGSGDDGATSEETTIASREFDRFGSSMVKTLSDGLGGQSRSGHRRETDELGRVASVTDQLGRTTRLAYTADGLVAKEISDTGRMIEREHHPKTRAVTRVRTTSPNAPTVDTAYEIDDVTGAVLSVYDPADPDATRIRYTSDADGNLTDTVYPDGSRLRNRYDEFGRRIASIDVAENVTEFHYRTDGLLERAVQVDRDGAPLAQVEYSYDSYGRILEVRRGNGVVTSYELTSSSDIASEITTDGDTAVAERRYSYDPSGRLTERVDTTRTDGKPVTTTTAYRYDAQSRLTESAVHRGSSTDGPLASTTAYELTVSGDLASESVTTDPGTPGEVTRTRSFEYSPYGELLAVTTGDERVEQAYDIAGNLARGDDGTRYTHDAANRPVTEERTDGSGTRTEYWADGTRRSRTITGPAGDEHVTTFYSEGGHVINDTHTDSGRPDPDTGAVQLGTASYLIGAMRHARTTRVGASAPSTDYYVTDRHGSVTELTGEDGEITVSHAYSDYGVRSTEGQVTAEPWADSLTRNPYGFAGELTDPDGSQYLRSRILDTDHARFREPDEKSMHNRFAFGNLNPITNIDPDGHDAYRDAVNWIVAGLGVAMALLSIVTTPLTGSASLIASGVIATAIDVAATAAATLNLVDSYVPDFLPDDIADGLMWSEFALTAGVGLSIFTAVKGFSNRATRIAHNRAAMIRDIDRAEVYFDSNALQGEGRILAYSDPKELVLSDGGRIMRTQLQPNSVEVLEGHLYQPREASPLFDGPTQGEYIYQRVQLDWKGNVTSGKSWYRFQDNHVPFTHSGPGANLGRLTGPEAVDVVKLARKNAPAAYIVKNTKSIGNYDVAGGLPAGPPPKKGSQTFGVDGSSSSSIKETSVERIGVPGTGGSSTPETVDPLLGVEATVTDF
jgi:RHS repeat-associated protein